jgi:hypothetical protein
MKILLGLFMASLLLLAGCPQDEPGVPPEGASDNGSIPAEGAPGEAQPQEGAPENGSLPQQGGPQEGTPQAAEEPRESGSEGDGPSGTAAGEFGEWDLDSIMGLGQPVHCTVKYDDGSVSSESELYLMGEKMRVESASLVEGEAFDMVMIMVGNVSYISMDAQAYGLDEDCEWIMMDFGRLQECMPESMLEDAGASTEAFDLEAEYADAPSDFSCEYGTFGEEMFMPEGKVCDFTEELCSIYDLLESQGA